MGDNNRNMFLAIALSLGIIIAWQYFFIEPKLQAEREAQRQAEIAAQQQAAQPAGNAAVSGDSGVPSAPAGTALPSAVPSAPDADIPQAPQIATPQPGGAIQAAPGTAGALTNQTRDSAVAAGDRVFIDTASVEGSINLTGARLDDLHLKGYHETVDPTSPTITLLSPGRLAPPLFCRNRLGSGPRRDSAEL